ncbi:MAG: [Fe-Fe] hydrogenase large subunit C-terminal domain-containing protein, partial [Christensenellales bacterium]
MSIIQLMEANCRNCYKCIRECPVKSISFNGEQAQIVGDECVLCGHCLQVCPQHAKQIRSQVDKVQELIDRGNKVYVSLAPSYPSYFKGVSLAQMSAALKALGVTQVEETAVGAARVSEEYERLMRQHEMKNIITTACPTVVLLVEKYYPELVPYLAPVASPLLAHAKTMKQVYGPRIKVVFVGPCISKKHDVEDPANEGLVSVALSFEELEQWMALKGVRFGAENPDQRGLRKPVARFYPEPGGILKTIDADVRATYKSVAADGMDRCMRALEAMRSGEMEGFFLELNACEGACIGGPSLSAANFFTSKELLGASIAATDQAGCYLSDETQADIRKRYHDLSPVKRMPTEAQIKEILASIGKTRPEDELNCGGCGYPSCREKAVAVFQGKADAQMCLPYMRQKAESMSNIVLQNTPSYIFILDEALIIQEANPAATAMLKMSREELI